MDKSLWFIVLFSIVKTSFGYQQEFYVPYSETEDVDFSISRNDGCFQWSTDALEILSLSPMLLDFKRQCGHVLEFRVLAKSANLDKETVLKIFAENVDENIEPDASSIFEYTIRVKPVAKLEIMGLKQKIKISDPPVPFGVSGFDSEGNEFDTLDGLQIRWFVGSEREILVFVPELNDHMSTTHVKPKAAGKASMIAVLEDPNYSKIEPALMEVNVLSPLQVEPDGVFLLPGGEVEFKLFEEVVTINGSELAEASVVGENPFYTFEVKDESIASLDKASSLVTALKDEGEETMLLVKNQEGQVVKSVPIRITNANSMAIHAYPTPDKLQLLESEEYEIKVEIFDKNKRPIYPSKNILCKTSYPSQFKVKELSENGLWAKVHTVDVGRGQVKAHLRSVLTPDDEEIEITPHLRANKIFEIYKQIKMKPSMSVLPWDENVRPEFELSYKVTGGSKLYTYSVDDEEMAVSVGNGRFRTLGNKGGSFNLRASMVNNEHIYAESEVHIVPPQQLDIDNHPSEIGTHAFVRIPVYMYGYIPDADDDLVAFNDCSDVPFQLKMTNEEDFKFDNKDSRGSARVGGSCASLFVSCSKIGATSNISVTYDNPSTNNVLSQTKSFQCFKPMHIVNPVVDMNYHKPKIYVAVGSNSKVIISDGPLPWFQNPDSFFRQVEIEDPDVIHVKRVTAEDDYANNVYDVTCKDEGETSFILTIGNKAFGNNKLPSRQSQEITVICSVPKKINLVLKDNESHKKVNVDSSSGKILLDQSKRLRMSLVLKDGEGHTLEGLESVKFSLKISDQKLMKSSTESFVVPKSNDVHVSIPARPYVDLVGQNISGDVTVEVSVEGYDESIFKSRGIPMPKPLPTEESDEEDEEDFDEYTDSIEFRLLSTETITSRVP